MRAEQVLRSSETILTTWVHCHPPTHGIREVYGPVLVVLVPAESLVRVHQKHVCGHADLLGTSQLRQDVSKWRVVQEVSEAIVGHPSVALNIVIQPTRAANQGPKVWVLYLELCGLLQELDPMLHATFDHDDTVLLELLDLCFIHHELLGSLPCHDSIRQCNFGILHAKAQLHEVDGLLLDCVLYLLLGACGDTTHAIHDQCKNGHGKGNVECLIHLLRLLQVGKAIDVVLQTLNLLSINAHSPSSGLVLGTHAQEGQHCNA
mmetsp:Transcript_32721/g.74799  ORF Transcript_32721/g.74799 Transcript_32721/m.74799 type:complete len:262 (+) Transcript_32721:588-1373(+)